MILRTIPVTPFEQNARVLIDEVSAEVTVVDPGGDVSRILDAIPATLPGEIERKTKVTAVLLTHSHIDHAGGVRGLLAEITKRQGEKPLLYGHGAEALMRQSIGQQALMFGLSPSEFEACPEPDVFLTDGDNFVQGQNTFQVLFTPGHSPGHLSFYSPKIQVRMDSLAGRGSRSSSAIAYDGPLVIAGDALFSGSIGRTDLPGGNHRQLLESIRKKLLTLPDETLVLPGHGENTSIGKERRSNPFLVE